MRWSILSIPITMGVAFLMYGIADTQILWKSTSLSWGFLLIAGSICLGILGELYKRKFDKLHFFELKRYANRWAKKYSNVHFRKIVLFNYSAKFQQYARHLKNGEFNPLKYAIVFEVPACIQEFDRRDYINTNPREAFDKMISGELDKDVSVCKEFISDTADYKALIDASFANVYKDKSNFDLKEWVFIPVKRMDDLPLGVEKNGPRWTLYRGCFHPL